MNNDIVLFTRRQYLTHNNYYVIHILLIHCVYVAPYGTYCRSNSDVSSMPTPPKKVLKTSYDNDITNIIIRVPTKRRRIGADFFEGGSKGTIISVSFFMNKYNYHIPCDVCILYILYIPTYII